MKLLLFSDLHLHEWKYASTPEKSRLVDGQYILAQIREYCIHNKVDRVIFLGDLFHTHGNVRLPVLSKAASMIKSISDEVEMVHLIPGNHDMDSRKPGYTALDFFTYFHTNIRVELLTVPIEADDNTNFYFIPYHQDGHVVKDILTAIAAQARNKPHILHLVFMHQGIANQPVGSGFVIDESVAPEDIPELPNLSVYTGHYHFYKRVHSSLTIVGNPMHQTWADAGQEKGFLVYDTDTRDHEFVKTDYPEFKEFSTDLALFLLKANNSDFKDAVQSNIIRLKGDISAADRRFITEEIVGQVRNLEFVPEDKPQTMDRPALKSTYDLSEIIRKYAETHNLSDEHLRIAELIGKENYEAL